MGEAKNTGFYQELIKIVDEDQICFDEPMTKHTTFKVGGPAEYFVKVRNTSQMSDLIKCLNQNEQKYYILGNGSNLLVSDKGYQGVMISCHEYMDDICVEGNIIYAGAGALLSKVAMTACKAGLKGMEFAAGIPGTVGGAVVMNAGAYGGEISQVLKAAQLVDCEGNILEYSCEQLELGYRTSVLKKKPLVCTGAIFELSEGDAQEIKKTIDELNSQRREKQPLEYPSAGSTFKRPEGYFAGKLIMDAGLRGYQVGGAQVSEKHCGFVINAGNATASDVKTLMDDVAKIVFEKYGVTLEPEVCMIGEF